MDGVTILNTYYAYTNSDAALLVFVITGLCLFIGMGVAAIVCEERWPGASIIIGSVILIGLMLNAISKVEHIQATVDDTVSWVELTDKYKIIKSEGRIITMIEKEQKDERNPAE